LERQSLLNGVRILDFGRVAAAPSGTYLLALLGAEVIRVESSTALDSYRKGDADAKSSSLFTSINAGKKSVAVNLKTEAGRQVALRMVREADVITENFSPGTMIRLGLGYEVVREQNPQIIMISASTSGQQGPGSRSAGYAPIFAALGGLADITGYNDSGPALFGRAVDARVGVFVALAALVGLFWRQREGVGCYLDLSAQEVIASLIGDVLTEVSATGIDSERVGNETLGHAGEGCYVCAGGAEWVFLELEDDRDWQSLVTLIGKDNKILSVLATADSAERWDRRRDVESVVEGWMVRRTATDALRSLQAAGLSAGIVRDAPQLFADLHLRSRNFWRSVDFSRGTNGPASTIAIGLPAIWLEGSTPKTPVGAAPLLGADTETVLLGVGLSIGDIERLRQEGVLD